MKKELLFLFLGIMAFAVTPLRASSSCGSVGQVSSPGCALSAGSGYYGATTPTFVVSNDGAVLNPVALAPSFTIGATIGGGGVGMVVSSGSTQLEAGPRNSGGTANGGYSDGGAPGFSKVFFKSDHGQRWGIGWTWDHGYSGSGEPGWQGLNSGGDTLNADPLAVTPEPFTLLLFGTGLILMALLMWRRDSVVRHRE